MTTTYILTFYSIIALLLIISMAAGYMVGRHKRTKPKSFPNTV